MKTHVGSFYVLIEDVVELIYVAQMGKLWVIPDKV